MSDHWENACSKNGPKHARERLLERAAEHERDTHSRKKIATGIAQLQAGLVVDGEKAVDEIVRSLGRRHDKTESE